MKNPEFIVVGAARAGTTALNYYLHQHPGIFLPAQKEPCFFCFAGEKLKYKEGKFSFAVTNKKKFEQLFSKAGSAQLTGEISTPYLFLHRKTIENIKKYHSAPAKVKIVILLRNPVERAYSQYLWKVRDGREKLSFEDSLREERKRMEQNYSFDYFYAHRGLYYEAVKNYMENFDSVKVILFDDFKDDFEKTITGLCDFLGIDSSFKFTRRDKINSSSIPRFASLGKLITVESKLKFRILNYFPDDIRTGIKERFMKWNSSKQFPPAISDAAKRYLAEFYDADVKRLQSLLGIDLSPWLKSWL